MRVSATMRPDVMRAATVRAVAVGLALSLCGLLLGLSHAQHALPGDMFQVARAASVAATAPGVDLPHGRKLSKASDDQADSPLRFAVLDGAVVADPVLVAVLGAGAGATVHHGRCAGSSGCRGPPVS